MSCPPLNGWKNGLPEYHQTDIQSLIQLEHCRQAMDQVTVGNIITSMRLLSALDWRRFVEGLSLVERVLEKDPAGVYPKMDFPTRDRYRHVVERLARRTSYIETQVAERALALAMKSEESEISGNSKRSHIGFFLIGEGCLELEKDLDYSARLKERVKRSALAHPTLVYLGSLTLLMFVLEGLALTYFINQGGSAAVAFCFVLIALIPASEFAAGILNHAVTMLLKPEPLPKMETEKTIPVDSATMVVIPTIFASRNVVQELLEKLQVHFFSNQDPHIYFALLGDFRDADAETLRTMPLFWSKPGKG